MLRASNYKLNDDEPAITLEYIIKSSAETNRFHRINRCLGSDTDNSN